MAIRINFSVAQPGALHPCLDYKIYELPYHTCSKEERDAERGTIVESLYASVTNLKEAVRHFRERGFYDSPTRWVSPAAILSIEAYDTIPLGPGF